MAPNGSTMAWPKRAIVSIDLRDAKRWEVRTEDHPQSRVKVSIAARLALA